MQQLHDFLAGGLVLVFKNKRNGVENSLNCLDWWSDYKDCKSGDTHPLDHCPCRGAWNSTQW